VEKESTRLRLSTSERKGIQSDVHKGQHEFCGSPDISRTSRVSHQSAAALCGHEAKEGDYYSAVGQVTSGPWLTLIFSELSSSMQLTATRGFRYLSLCSTGPPRITPPLAHFRARSALSVADATFCGCTLFPVGCSRLGACHHRGGWLFSSRCAPPRSRLAVPVPAHATAAMLAVPASIRAASAAVGSSRFGARRRACDLLNSVAVRCVIAFYIDSSVRHRRRFCLFAFFGYFLAISRRHRHVVGSHEVAQRSTSQRRRAHQRSTLPYNNAVALRICLLSILFGWFEFCLSSDGRQQIGGCNPRSAARIERSAV